MRRIIFAGSTVVAALWAACYIAAAVTPNTGHTSLPQIECSDCHTCEAPSSQDRCLKSCPSLTVSHTTSEHRLSEAPGKIVLDQIADQYKPVQFDHKVHAGMAEMGLKCATCHHFSPPGRIPPCGECHGGQTNPGNLRQPGLKGAYHRQCMSCHREWSHDVKCVICHLPADGAMTAGALDSTDIIGISHPIITEPTKKVYRTTHQEGPMVTFYHKEHIELYGLSCANCHQRENCRYCHDLAKFSADSSQAPVMAKTPEEVHSTCQNCHSDDECSKCHDTREKPPFMHAQTGWELNRYHEELQCRACHPTGKSIARLDNQCVTCHAGWDQSSFKHAVTGLQLDEVHAEASCNDCHSDLRYDRPAVCAGCHDDGRTAGQAPPGTVVTSSMIGVH